MLNTSNLQIIDHEKVIIDLYEQTKKNTHDIYSIVDKRDYNNIMKNYYQSHLLLHIQIILMKHILKDIDIYTTNNLNEFLHNKYKNIKFMSACPFADIMKINNDKIIKIRKLEIFDYYVKNEQEFIDELLKEYKLLQLTNKYNISPKPYNIYFIIVDSWIFSIIEMDFFDGIYADIVLIDLPEKPRKILYDKIFNKIKMLDKLHINHNDLHFGNILVKKTHNDYDIKIIDYTLSTTQNKISCLSNAPIVFNYLFVIRFNIKQYLLNNFEVYSSTKQPLILYKKQNESNKLSKSKKQSENNKISLSKKHSESNKLSLSKIQSESNKLSKSKKQSKLIHI